MEKARLPDKLRMLRAQQGLTITEASKKIGITRDTLAGLERGTRKPQMPTLAKLSKAYGVPIGELDADPQRRAAPTVEDTTEDVFPPLESLNFGPREPLNPDLVHFARGVLMAVDVAEKALTESGWDREKIDDFRARMVANGMRVHEKRVHEKFVQAEKVDLDQPPPQISTDPQVVEQDA